MIKKLITLLFIFCISFNKFSFGQGMWTWMGGTDSFFSTGVYGTKNVPSTTNIPPARYEACYWTDLDGIFWLWGGGANGFMNDLWKFNPVTNEWTWVHGPQYQNNIAGHYGTKGIPSPLNVPPARGFGSNCWTGEDGHLYLFGGGDNIGRYNDLWRYNINTNEWTWIAGSNILRPNNSSPNYAFLKPKHGTKGFAAPTNDPGDRLENKSSWVFDNKLWFFGGNNNSGSYNDMWTFDLGTYLWTWVAGPNTQSSLGYNGTKGISSPQNVPSARMSYTKWKDQYNNFYLFGGKTSLGQYGHDLWSFNPKTLLWTWLGGKDSVVRNINSTVCDLDNNNWPNSQFENTSPMQNPFAECATAFWAYSSLYKNALQIYNSFENKWILVWQNSQPDYYNYGTKGVPSINNVIRHPRWGSCQWVDKNENLWIFGGAWVKNVFNAKSLNDMWKFSPDTNCYNMLTNYGLTDFKFDWPNDFEICLGDSAIINIPKGINADLDLVHLSGQIFRV